METKIFKTLNPTPYALNQVHSELRDPASSLWVVQGRVGPAVLLAMVVWLVCYTLLAIALKWVLVGSTLKPNSKP